MMRQVDEDIDEMPDSTARRNNPDSVKAARARIADSIQQARTQIADSIKQAREEKADNIATVRKQKTDSLAAVKKYRESRRYRDSVADIRSSKTKALGNRADSIKKAREYRTDSIANARKEKTDSIAAVKKYRESRRYRDSVAEARAAGRVQSTGADSLKQAREHRADSIAAARKHRTDSTAAARKYRESKHYRDSVADARAEKSNTIKTARQERMDSLKEARASIADSIATARKERTDSIKAVQKIRTDSLAAKKKYKESKRYADSVSVAKHDRLDSIRNAQKAQRDAVAAVRKQALDSAKESRKQAMDSVKTVRAKRLDSMKTVQKAKTDSLAKRKADKEKIAKTKEKKKMEASKLKIELKIKQKHEAWTNKSMLKKRWSPIRRVAQNSFTHYNYYYNANRKMDEAMVNMQRTRKENYDSLIGLYPFDPNRDSALLLADMDSIVRKVSVGIQIHDPRVKWSNDLYLLLGQAYYYKANYENASIAFRYIISTDEAAKKKNAKGGGQSSSAKSKDGPSILEEEKSNFLKHKSVHNEAILWLARTFTGAGQVENAESVLSLLETDTKLPNNLKGRLAVEKAFAYLADGNLPEASKQLTIVTDDNNLPNWLRLRAGFLNGQLQQDLGNYREAANNFEHVLTYYPKIEMDFYSRKYAAFNRLQAGDDVETAMRPLKKVLNDGKYLSYYDQVYFVLGKIAEKANKTDDAITYFTKSTRTPRATKKQKAISFSALGDVYYASSQYVGAKRAYDSAAKYMSSAPKDMAVLSGMQKNKGLTEVSGPINIIHDQDSLLELSTYSKREQLLAARHYIRLLEQQQKDSIFNAENAAPATTTVAAEADGAPKDNSWYFGNAILMQQGSMEFKRKWGNRPLVDNWRRAGSINTNSTGSGADEVEEAPAALADNGIPTEESLLARIPNTPQQKEQAAKNIQKAYMMLAKAYMKQLEDYNQAGKTLDTLDKRYPNHIYKEEELYVRYQLAIKQNQLDKAFTYSQELLNKYPNSQYAALVKPKQSESKQDALVGGKTVSAYFDETYALLMQHQYTEALMHVNVAKKEYGDSVYKKRFEVTEAMAFAGTGDYNMGDSLITKFLKSHPADSLTPWASTVKDYIKDMRTLGKPSWYKELPPGQTTTGAGTKTATAAPRNVPPPPPPPPPIPAPYAYHADSEHYCIIVLPGLELRTGRLKKAIISFDSARGETAGLSLLMDLYNMNQGVLVIQKFANAAAAKAYILALQSSTALQEYGEGEIKVMAISTANYRRMFYERDATPYVSFYNAYYK